MNPYQKYKNQSIESMSQLELLLTLYDEAIKDLKRMDLALEDKDYEGFESHMDYFTRIIRYLVRTLDLSQPVAADLNRLYQYILYDCGRISASRERRRDEIQALIEIISDLRDGFKQAGTKTNVERIAEEKRVIV